MQRAHEVLHELASARGGVLSRREVVACGVPRWVLQAELRTRRWQRTGRQTVVTHNGPLSELQRRVVAAVEVGPRAALDGTTALQHHGVDVRDDRLHVIAPKGSTPKHPVGVVVHESRRFAEADVVVRGGVRVVRPAVAAVHAGLWAASDKQARFFLLLVVQQRAAPPAAVRTAVESVRRSRRRRVMLETVDLLEVGVRSVGEADFTAALRHWGLPEPDRQVLRQRPSGRQYLDCRWDAYALTAEIDGLQHDAPEHRLADVVRDLALIAEGDDVVRIPLAALRLDDEGVMRGLQRVFAARGWRQAA